MQAKISHHGEIVVVRLSGRVDVETAEPFRKACLDHLIEKKVVFDFKELSFVGSSGILPFLETMQTFETRNANGFKFSSVGSEFKKIFAATSLQTIEIFETHLLAIQAFINPPIAAVHPAPQVNSFGAAIAASTVASTTAPDIGTTDVGSSAIERADGSLGASQPRDFGLLNLRPEVVPDTQKES